MVFEMIFHRKKIYVHYLSSQMVWDKKNYGQFEKRLLLAYFMGKLCSCDNVSGKVPRRLDENLQNFG